MYKLFFEDLEVGREVTFGSYKVTKEEVIEFAQKYDPQYFHTDEELAKKSVFGGLCASGWHTSAMLMRMMVDRMADEGLAGLGSPGIDNLRWLKPVFPGDTLSATAKLLEKRDSKSRPELGLVKDHTTVFNDKGEKLMEVTSNYMVAKRPR
ncbi:MaoC family dehydratase [Kordiimonas pumila]|uniref:MaoC family dehydratase n=1 Tax=Kordiimonas pumila TaxID=2161677 RepID=A0ABV7D3K6_9PROT|nr:MaoC family dehydratase [Kordiimonas pumila]